MEIEDLKDIWKKQSEGFKRKNETELTTMLNGKSKSIISRLKRNVWFELIFTFLGGLGLLSYAITIPGGALKWTSISILILFCIYSFYYVEKLRLLNGFSAGNEDIKANLQRLTASLSSYLKFYRRSYSILYPVYFFLGLLFTAIEQGTIGFLNKVTKPAIFIPLLLGAGLFFICSTWLTSWYLRKLYGNHLDKLKGLLRELDIS
jgi:hypothetical protein